MNQKVFATNNLKLAGALTAAGFRITYADLQIIETKDDYGRAKDKHLVVCELSDTHHGVEANDLRLGYENETERVDLAGQVDEIIKTRGITPNEYVILAFDAARAGIHNQQTIWHCVKNNKPMRCKQISNGRTLIYREGTPKEELKKLLDNA